MAEPAPDEVADYFIRCTLDANTAKRYEQQIVVVTTPRDQQTINETVSNFTFAAESEPEEVKGVEPVK